MSTNNAPAEKKKARKTAIIYAALIISCLLMFVFAYLQKLEATKQRALAEELKIEAERQRERAEIEKSKAVEAQMLAEQSRILAEENRSKAEQALADCQKKIKK